MFIFIVIVCVPMPAYSEYTYEQYKNVKDSKSFKSYIGAVGVGINWANSRLSVIEGRSIYCAPDKLSINTENYLRILQAYIEKNEELIEPNMAVENFLLEGLIDTFPC